MEVTGSSPVSPTLNTARKRAYMPKVNVSVPHKVGKTAAKERAQQVVLQLIEVFEGKDGNVAWEGDNCDFKFKSLGFNIKGRATVSEETVDTEVELPFAAMLFKSKTERAIKKYMTKALE